MDSLPSLTFQKRFLKSGGRRRDPEIKTRREVGKMKRHEQREGERDESITTARKRQKEETWQRHLLKSDRLVFCSSPILTRTREPIPCGV